MIPQEKVNVWGDLDVEKGDKCVRCGCNKLELLHRCHGLPYMPEGSKWSPVGETIVICKSCWEVLRDRINDMARDFWATPIPRLPLPRRKK